MKSAPAETADSECRQRVSCLWVRACAVQVTGFQLTEETEADICSDDPWIILHKLDSPSKMRYIGARVAGCPEKSGAEALVVPASIAPWVAKIGASFVNIHVVG